MFALLLVSLAFAGGGKKDKGKGDETPPPPPPADPAPVDAPPPPDDTPPPPPPPPASNANFHATLTYADGHTVSGHVVRLERGVDRYAETGWVEDPAKLKVEVDLAGAETIKAWTDLTEISLKYGAKSTYQCLYESDPEPDVYMCTVDTTTAAKGTDGKTYNVNSRYTWQLTFDDGKVVPVVLTKAYVRKPDPTNGDDENYALYTELQGDLAKYVATGLTKIVITP